MLRHLTINGNSLNSLWEVFFWSSSSLQSASTHKKFVRHLYSLSVVHVLMCYLWCVYDLYCSCNKRTHARHVTGIKSFLVFLHNDGQGTLKFTKRIVKHSNLWLHILWVLICYRQIKGYYNWKLCSCQNFLFNTAIFMTMVYSWHFHTVFLLLFNLGSDS